MSTPAEDARPDPVASGPAVLAWAWVVVGALLPPSGFLPLGWALVYGDPHARDQSGPVILGVLGFLGLPVGLVCGGLAIAAGLGLRRGRGWARWLAGLLPVGALLLTGLVAAWAPHALAFLAFLFPGVPLLALLGLVTWPLLALGRSTAPP